VRREIEPSEEPKRPAPPNWLILAIVIAIFGGMIVAGYFQAVRDPWHRGNRGNRGPGWACTPFKGGHYCDRIPPQWDPAYRPPERK
jgi:hypothetical protein